MQDIISETFNLHNIGNLPVIATGRDIYKQSLQELVEEIPDERYMCDNLKSHIDELEKELNTQIADLNKIKNEIQKVEFEQNECQTEINQIQTAIQQYENQPKQTNFNGTRKD